MKVVALTFDFNLITSLARAARAPTLVHAAVQRHWIVNYNSAILYSRWLVPCWQVAAAWWFIAKLHLYINCLYHACVLYPFHIRLRVAKTFTFHCKWLSSTNLYDIFIRCYAYTD